MALAQAPPQDRVVGHILTIGSVVLRCLYGIYPNRGSCHAPHFGCFLFAISFDIAVKDNGFNWFRVDSFDFTPRHAVEYRT